MSIKQVIKALANDRRPQVLEWLKDPEAHVDGAFGLWTAASPRLANLTAGFKGGVG